MKSLRHRSVRIYIGDTAKAARRLYMRGRRCRMVFLDPPFNYARDYGDGFNDKHPLKKYRRMLQNWMVRAGKLLHPNGVMIVNIPDEHASFVDTFACEHMKFKRLNWCIWHYQFGQNMTSKFGPSKVHVFVFAKGPDHVWNWKDVLVPSLRATVYNDKRTNNKKDGSPNGMKVPLDVWHGPGFSRVTGNSKERRKGHDNQLPEQYMRRIVMAYTNKGDTIYDAFAGSGTLPTVALSLGRICYAAEQSEKHARSAIRRVRQGPVTE